MLNPGDAPNNIIVIAKFHLKKQLGIETSKYQKKGLVAPKSLPLSVPANSL